MGGGSSSCAVDSPLAASKMYAVESKRKSAMESVDDALKARASKSVAVGTVDPSEFFNFDERGSSFLGQGGFGEVFKATDKSDGATVAMKKSHIVRKTKDVDGLFKEAELLRKCESPYVVQFRGAFLWKYRVYLFTEYCPLGSLDDVLNRTKKALPEKDVFNAMQDCVEGLVCLHSMKVMHRDIKPANILVDSKGVCKLVSLCFDALADFGVALAWDILGVPYTGAGTPGFVAPEISDTTDPYTEAVDIYSLGQTCIELVQYINVKRESVPKEPNGYNMSFYLPFVAKCRAEDPKKRASAVELSQFLSESPATLRYDHFDSSTHFVRGKYGWVGAIWLSYYGGWDYTGAKDALCVSFSKDVFLCGVGIWKPADSCRATVRIFDGDNGSGKTAVKTFAEQTFTGGKNKTPEPYIFEEPFGMCGGRKYTVELEQRNTDGDSYITGRDVCTSIAHSGVTLTITEAAVSRSGGTSPSSGALPCFYAYFE